MQTGRKFQYACKVKGNYPENRQNVYRPLRKKTSIAKHRKRYFASIEKWSKHMVEQSTEREILMIVI